MHLLSTPKSPKHFFDAPSRFNTDEKTPPRNVPSILQTKKKNQLVSRFDLPPYGFCGLFLFGPEMEYTLQEERNAKLQVEEKLLQLKKDHSMLDCDYKQAQNKLDELQAQKEKLSEEVIIIKQSLK